nr:hypothetical protein [Tanacetum cinerariifolium]
MSLIPLISYRAEEEEEKEFLLKDIPNFGSKIIIYNRWSLCLESSKRDGVVETDGGGKVVTIAFEGDSCIGVRTEGSEITNTGTVSMDRD